MECIEHPSTRRSAYHYHPGNSNEAARTVGSTIQWSMCIGKTSGKSIGFWVKRPHFTAAGSAPGDTSNSQLDVRGGGGDLLLAGGRGFASRPGRWHACAGAGRRGLLTDGDRGNKRLSRPWAGCALTSQQ